jgi:hypothetical protein
MIKTNAGLARINVQMLRLPVRRFYARSGGQVTPLDEAFGRPVAHPAVTPVIHVVDLDQVLHNLDIVAAAGCPGAFLINHDFPMEPFLPLLRELRAARPDMWLGVNFLAQPGQVAFPVLGALARDGAVFQAYWADDGRIDERVDEQGEAQEIARIRAESGWQGLYLGGVAFKKQRPVAKADYATAAHTAKPYHGGGLHLRCCHGA